MNNTKIKPAKQLDYCTTCECRTEHFFKPVNIKRPDAGKINVCLVCETKIKGYESCNAN